MSGQLGPTTLAARALLTRVPGGRGTMRGVAMSELSRLLALIEQEATAPFRAELGWALELLEQYEGQLLEHGDNPMEVYSPDRLAHKAAIRRMLDEP